MEIISNCFLCEERSLHVLPDKSMQCLNCGYASSDRFLGTKKDNEVYPTLPDDMKGWAKESDGRIWVPTLFTTPFAVLYPFNDDDGNLKWGYADMVDIPEGEQKDYPMEGQEGKFHTKKYDTDNPDVFDEFIYAMSKLNEMSKSKSQEHKTKVKLPKLTKVNG